MNRAFVIIIFLLFVNNILTSQTIFFSDSIKWEKSQVSINVGTSNQYVMSFDGGFNRYDDLLPVYYSKKEINSNLKVESYSIVNAKYELINIDNFKQVKNLDKITENVEISFSNSTFRNINNIGLNIVPIRRNPLSREFEVLTYFEIKADCSSGNLRTRQKRNVYTNNSVLSNGKWRKVKVSKSGVHKVTYSELVDMGFSDMSSIGVFGYGGVLPYIAGDVVADDLPERPVFRVDVNNNGTFDNGDYFLFYADGPNNVYFNKNKKFSHELNTCSEYAYYFISDRGSWLQANSEASLDSHNKEVNVFDDYIYLEKDSLNLIRSGRTFYWKNFNHRLSHNFSVNIPDISLSDAAIVKVNAAARATLPSSMSVFINGSSKPSIAFKQVSLSTETGNFADKASGSYQVSPNSNTFNVNLNYIKSSSYSEAWLDYISFQFRRKLRLNGGEVVFRDLESVAVGENAKFNVSNANNKTIVWDISDRFSSKSINGTLSGPVYSFVAACDLLKEYVAFDYSVNFPSVIYKGNELGFIENQNLHSLGFADIIIVTHRDFYAQAKRLAKIHEVHDGMKSHVVLQDQIFNEFSSGTPSVSGIRNFVKMFYDRANSAGTTLPTCLTLFGDGSYNNLSESGTNTNFILTYQTEESLNLTNAMVVDDFFGYLDDGEGNIHLNDDVDLGIGRIPVTSAEAADNYLEKIESYYSSASLGNYKNNVIILGDDADDNQPMHQKSADLIATNIEKFNPCLIVERVFLDDYPQLSSSSGQTYPEVNQVLDDYVNSGVGIVTWLGHGSPRNWAHERVLSIDMIRKWRNKDKYPIFVSATCSFSPFDNPDFVSGGEEVVLCREAGGIVLFGTTRVAFAGANENISNAFFKELFTKDEQGRNHTIGMSAAKAKNTLVGDSNKRVYAVLGDPAIRFFSPEYEVNTLKINGVAIADYTDVIKAKELVKFEGEVVKPDGSLASDFNGIIYPTVFDKKMEYETRNNEGYGSLKYTAQKNILFNGKASVKNGKFSFSFIVPVDIAYFNDRGKIIYYANGNNKYEATGVDTTFFIGGSINEDLADKEGPVVDLFFNDEQFIPGSVVNESPILLANVFDESGINTIGNGIGHDITMQIDENTSNTVVLNKFYESEIDDFKRGKINYPISNLEVGPHTLTIKAWDVLNNSSVSTIDCIVANSEDLVIEHLFNYPNPFTTNTSFYFDHNQPFVKLDVVVQVFTISGKHVKTIYRDMITTGNISDPIIWDGKDEYGDKIGKGVYIYKVKVKTENGLNANKFEKLVILN